MKILPEVSKSYVSIVDGVLRGKYMVALRCHPWSLSLTSIQSKDKFLGAVKGDGFGFCSIILQVAYSALTSYHLDTSQRMGYPRYRILARVTDFEQGKRVQGHHCQGGSSKLSEDTLGVQCAFLPCFLPGPGYQRADMRMPPRNALKGHERC